MNGSRDTHARDFPAGDAWVTRGKANAWPQAAIRLPGPSAPVPPSHHGHDLERWPLRNALILEATESAARSARAHLQQLLRNWRRPELSEDAGVVVSELVTNSFTASAQLRPSAPVLVWLGAHTHRVLLAVADASPQPPTRLDLEPDAEGGRGLTLVEALASRWGWHPASITGLVKVVWAEWYLPPVYDRRTAVSRTSRCHAV